MADGQTRAPRQSRGDPRPSRRSDGVRRRVRAEQLDRDGGSAPVPDASHRPPSSSPLRRGPCGAALSVVRDGVGPAAASNTTTAGSGRSATLASRRTRPRRAAPVDRLEQRRADARVGELGMAGPQVEQDGGQRRDRVAQRAAPRPPTRAWRALPATARRPRRSAPARKAVREGVRVVEEAEARSGRGTGAAHARPRRRPVVASESVDRRGRADRRPGRPSSADGRDRATACRWSRLATANGPDPTGGWPNGSSGSAADREPVEQVGRRDRLGRGLEEAAERRRSR